MPQMKENEKKKKKQASGLETLKDYVIKKLKPVGFSKGSNPDKYIKEREKAKNYK